MCGRSGQVVVCGASALAAAMLLASCAVGPDFLHPAAPEITRYTREPLASRTSSTGADRTTHISCRAATFAAMVALFKSPALNALIEQSLQNNPNLQSALATLRAAKETVDAQEGKFFPFVQANFNPTRQRTSAILAPVPASGASIFHLDTAQLTVAYTFDIWGFNRRTVESLEALADVQRFQVEAAYLSLTSNIAVAAITEASLRGQIDATVQIIATNTKMLDTLQRQLYRLRQSQRSGGTRGGVGAGQGDAAAAAQGAAQQRDLMAALAGAYPSDGPRETSGLRTCICRPFCRSACRRS